MRPARPKLLDAAVETMLEGEPLEPRQLEPSASLLLGLSRALDRDETRLARATALGLLDRLSKKREWGAQPREVTLDLDAAARLERLAPDAFGDEDVARFVEEIGRLYAPPEIHRFLDIYTAYGLPRTAGASAAIIDTMNGSYPFDGVLQELFCRGFRIDDATLRRYAETLVADRFAVDDLLFVIQRIESKAVLARLPAFAGRLMAWVGARRPDQAGADARRRVYHNAVVALIYAHEHGVDPPDGAFLRYVEPSASRCDLSIDDVASAFTVFGRSTGELLDARLGALRGMRATDDALTELVEVAALMGQARHPRADLALELVQRETSRPLGLDERIGTACAGRGYDADAVRRLTSRLAGPLEAANCAPLYFELLASLLREQGETGLAAILDGRRLARR